MSEVIGPGKVVGLVYDLRDQAGNLIESRTPEDPVYYVHGQGLLLPVLERDLEGKSEGYLATINVSPEDAYGLYDENLVTEVERSLFPKNLEIHEGMKFDTKGPHGESLVVEVIKVENEIITIDGNHPLAGIELKFDLRVLMIRVATEEEIKTQTPQEYLLGIGNKSFH